MRMAGALLAAAMAASALSARAAVDMDSSYDFEQYTFAQKDALSDAVGDELKILDKGTDEMRDSARDDKSEETIADLTDLEAKKAVAHTTYDVFRDVDSMDAWNKSRDRMEEALEDYRAAYEKAMGRLRDRMTP
jgi:hypothetical protein